MKYKITLFILIVFYIFNSNYAFALAGDINDNTVYSSEYKKCLDAPNGRSMNGLVQCAGEEIERWNPKLEKNMKNY
ncbi:MAG: hypothetical protein K1X44_05995 [Alphaproteobacteria bacterium]|nr:hypothetical protein [Alphaproteobacteria bacterium]